MVPILSGHHRRQRQARHHRPRLHCCRSSYVSAWPSPTPPPGVACAAAGKEVQAMFQQWWVIALFAALFVAMALSMFGLFTVQMPASIQTRLARAQQPPVRGHPRRRRGHGGAVGAHRDHLRRPGAGRRADRDQPDRRTSRAAARRCSHRASAWGRRCLMVGASAGKLLPKAGPWMDCVKKVFGVADARRRRLDARRASCPARLTLLLVGGPGADPRVAAVDRDPRALRGRMGTARRRPARRRLWRGARRRGRPRRDRPAGADPGIRRRSPGHCPSVPSTRSRTSTVRWRRRAPPGAACCVDFSADWCTSCKEMERYTFTDPNVQLALKSTRAAARQRHREQRRRPGAA